MCVGHLKILTVAFGESTMSRTQVQVQYNWFKKGRDVNDNACPGSSSTSTTDKNTEAVKKIILHKRRINIIPCSDKHFYCVNLNKCHY